MESGEVRLLLSIKDKPFKYTKKIKNVKIKQIFKFNSNKKCILLDFLR